jgi:hypothetical protein
MTTGKFVFEWVDPAQGNDQQAGSDVTNVSRRDTEVFVPDLISRGRKLVVKGLGQDQYYHDKSRQTLYITPTVSGTHKITVTLDPPLQPRFRVNSFWGDFGARLVFLCACLVGLISYLLHYLL